MLGEQVTIGYVIFVSLIQRIFPQLRKLKCLVESTPLQCPDIIITDMLVFHNLNVLRVQPMAHYNNRCLAMLDPFS